MKWHGSKTERQRSASEFRLVFPEIPLRLNWNSNCGPVVGRPSASIGAVDLGGQGFACDVRECTSSALWLSSPSWTNRPFSTAPRPTYDSTTARNSSPVPSTIGANSRALLRYSLTPAHHGRTPGSNRLTAGCATGYSASGASTRSWRRRSSSRTGVAATTPTGSTVPTVSSPPPNSLYRGPRPTNPKLHSDWKTKGVPLT